MTLVHIPQEVLEPGERTLDELATIVNSEHHETLGALLNALQHAIRAGDALIEARQKCEERNIAWAGWREDHISFANQTCDKYIRLAYYKAYLPAELLNAPYEPNRPGLTVALEYLRGLPRPDWKNANRLLDYEEVRRLHKAGVPNKEIARLLGAAPGTVRRAAMSVSERRKFDYRKTRMKEARVRERQRAEVAQLNAPPDLADAYSLIRKALQRVQAAHDATKHSERGGLGFAITNLHHAEDAVARAIKERT